METTPRRKARQQRSSDNVERVLDAAERCFLENGLSRSTTNHIAESAGLSIGALYRFFPNKESILVALVTRYIETQKQALDHSTSTTPQSKVELEVAVSAGIDSHRQALKKSRFMQFLLRECTFNPSVRRLFADYDAHQHSQVSIFLRSVNSHISNEKLDTVTRMLTQVLAGIQLLALDQTEATAMLTLAEGKKLVTAYLSSTLYEEE